MGRWLERLCNPLSQTRTSPLPGEPRVAAFLRSGGRVTEPSLSPAAGAMGFILAAKHMTKKLIVFFWGGWFLPLFVSSPPPGVSLALPLLLGVQSSSGVAAAEA